MNVIPPKNVHKYNAFYSQIYHKSIELLHELNYNSCDKVHTRMSADITRSKRQAALLRSDTGGMHDIILYMIGMPHTAAAYGEVQ